MFDINDQIKFFKKKQKAIRITVKLVEYLEKNDWFDNDELLKPLHFQSYTQDEDINDIIVRIELRIRQVKGEMKEYNKEELTQVKKDVKELQKAKNALKRLIG